MTRAKIFLVVLGLFLFIYFILAKPQATSLKSKTIDILYSPLKIAYNIPKGLKYLNPFYYIYKKEIELKTRIAYLNKRILELNELACQNNNLRKLLNFKSRYPTGSIASEIIAKDPTNWSSLIIIDKGSRDGIARDMCVISIYGLVGRVYDVSSNTAKVILITDTDSRLGAYIERSREEGLLVGLNENLCRLVYLADDADVKKGDIVVTSGLTGIFPKGLLIGEIIHVGKDLNNLYKYADVRPASKPTRLEEVLCIK